MELTVVKSELLKSEFASIYNTKVPNSYRVVNTQDYAPNYPKPSFTSYIKGNVYHYTHVGQEWSFTYPLYNHLYMPEEGQASWPKGSRSTRQTLKGTFFHNRFSYIRGFL